MGEREMPKYDVEKLSYFLDMSTDSLYEAIRLIDRHVASDMGADGTLSYYERDTLDTMRTALFEMYKQLFVNTREEDVFWMAKNYAARAKVGL